MTAAGRVVARVEVERMVCLRVARGSFVYEYFCWAWEADFRHFFVLGAYRERVVASV